MAIEILLEFQACVANRRSTVDSDARQLNVKPYPHTRGRRGSRSGIRENSDAVTPNWNSCAFRYATFLADISGWCVEDHDLILGASL